MRSIRERAERAALAVASALLVLSSACSKELPPPLPAEGTDKAAPARGGVFQLASFGDIRALDPANVSDGLAPQILEHLFAGLVDYDADGAIRPGIAERWEIVDEGRTYRFFLRQGVRFHDGEEVTASDIERSAVRALHGTAPNPYASYFSMISGFAELNAKKSETLRGVTVEGRYVVSFHLDAPDATFLRVLGLLVLRPVCRSAGDRYSDAWTACGAGPFKLGDGGWKRGRSVELVRHDAYYEKGLPYLDGVRWTFHQNGSTQSFKFFQGELDLVRDVPTPELLRFQADPRWKPFADLTRGSQIIGEAMNVEMPPFDNVEIRRAVVSAIDREDLQKLRAANLAVANQLVPPGVFGWDEDLVGQRFDYPAALEHMRRAGFPYDPATGTGGWPHVVPYLVYKQGLQEYTGQVLAQQLARIGIRIEIRVVNYPTFIALSGRRRTSTFGPGMWLQDYPDALSFLEPLFHSRSIGDEDSTNAAFYANPRFDELVDRAHRELDDARRKRIYSEAQAVLVDDAPWAFTETFRYYTQRQGYVRGDRTHPVWMVDLARTWLDRVPSPTAGRTLFGRRGLASIFGEDRREVGPRASAVAGRPSGSAR